MSDDPCSPDFGCTLDAREFRVRDGEFRRLFAGHLRSIQESDERHVELGLDPACEDDLRDLLSREQECCSFFRFELQVTSETITLFASVPDGSEAALAFLLSLRPVIAGTS